MEKPKFISLGFVIVVLIMVVLGIGTTVLTSFNDHSAAITVTDKERVVDTGNNTSKYLVMGKDEDGNPVVYENTDNLIRMKFNSSNIQADMEIGKTYQVTVVGYRIPFLSMYENIIEYTEEENNGL